MNIISFKCKIYNETDSEFEPEFKIDTLNLDIDMVSAFHAAIDKNNTIVYCDGTSHEILITQDVFAQIKGVSSAHKPIKQGFLLVFSKN